MDQEPDSESPLPPPALPKPVVPPPDLSPRPPPPLSPLESLPRKPSAAPPLSDEGNPAARVNLHSGDHEEDSDLESGPPPVAFNTRCIAAAIDLVVAFGILVGLLLLLPNFADRLAYLVAIAYLLARDTIPFLGGQSVGKKAMKIRAVTVAGKSLVGNWEAALIRNGVLIIPFFVLVELFILLSREDKPERGRRLGDEWAKTRVIAGEKLPILPDDGPPPPTPVG